MTISLSSARRLAAGPVGASAVAGAMLFGATPAANAAPAHIPAVQGPAHVVQPVRGGGAHGGWGPGGGVGHGGWGGPGTGWGGHPGWGNGGWGPPGLGYRPWWNGWWW